MTKWAFKHTPIPPEIRMLVRKVFYFTSMSKFSNTSKELKSQKPITYFSCGSRRMPRALPFTESEVNFKSIV